MVNKGKRAHPPKKKHQNKVRKEEIIPLSDAERGAKSQEEFEKSMIHLIEAERMASWGQAPNACVHAAYYAMHHSAAAAILASGGVGRYRDAPKSHEHIIQHYGKLIEKEPGYLGESGMALNLARGDRMVADYDLVRGATHQAAVAAATEARKFVDAVKEKWDFYDQITEESD